MNNDDCVVKFRISEKAICVAFSEYMNFKWSTCRKGIKFKFPKQFGCTVPRKHISLSNFAKNFQMKFSNIVHCELLHAPWNISKKWQHSIIWGPNREEQLLHSGVISFLRLRLANQFSCPCFTTFIDIACFQWPTYQDCYFSKNFILLCTTYFTKYYHMPPCHEWVSYS